jgi:uncharacterized integral membrane protein
MQIFIILALLIAIVAVVFAVQNTAMITVSFLVWSFEGSLALVLLATLLVGVLISLLASTPGLIRGKWNSSRERKKLASLVSERDNFQKRADQAEKDVKELEEQLASYSAELEKLSTEHPPIQEAPPPVG